jgi:Type I restriction modification DNA specificity domain
MNTVPLNRVFIVGQGNKFDLNKMNKCAPSDEAVAFVGRSGERNGVVAFVDKLDATEPYESGLITVALGGSAVSSFVQPRSFYTGQNINVLTPRAAMSLDVKLYYCLCVEANRFRYSTFGREANRTLKNLLIPAPECVPSWVDGATAQAVEGLCQNLNDLVAATEESQTMKFNSRSAPLHPEDCETRTVGCRHTNPDICSKNEMPNVCAFVRADGICLAPPSSWPKQYRHLIGVQAHAKKETG